MNSIMNFSKHLSFTLVSALCCAQSAIALDESAQDVRLGAVTVPQAIKQLEAIYSVSLNASGTVKDDVIFLSASSVTLAEIQEKIAQVLNAEWKKDGETWTLIRLGATERDEWEKLYSGSETLIKDSIAKSLKEVEATPEFDEAQANELFGQVRQGRMGGVGDFDMNKLMRALPGGRAMIQVLSKIPASEIAKIPVGARAVFSTKPTRVQGAIPGNILPIAAQLVKESSVLQGAAMRTFAPPGTNVPAFPNEPPTGPVAQAMVVISRSATGETFTCSMTVADADGNSLASGSHSIQLQASDLTKNKIDFPKGKEMDFSPFAPLISLLKTVSGSSDGLTLSVEFNISGAVFGGRPRPGFDANLLTPTIKDAIRQPEKFEPLNLFIGPALQEVSKLHDLDIVGWLPDSLVTNRTNVYGTTVKDSAQFVNHILTTGALKGSLSGSWMTFVPEQGVAARTQRIDRGALGILLRNLNSKGMATLVEQGNYAVTSPAASPRAFDTIFGQILAPEAVIQVLNGDDRARDVLRVFGALAPNQRFTLLNNERVLVGALSSPARTALNHLVYWSPDGPRSSAPNQGRMRGGFMMMMGGGPIQDVATERTNVLSNGIPNEASIGIEQLTEPMALVQMTDGSSQQMGARQIALTKMMANPEGPIRMMGAGSGEFTMPEMKAFKVLEQSVFTFDFLLRPQYGMRRTVSVPLAATQTGFVGFDQLPATFLAMVKQYEEEMANRMGRGPGGGGPGGPGGGGRPRP